MRLMGVQRQRAGRSEPAPTRQAARPRAASRPRGRHRRPQVLRGQARLRQLLLQQAEKDRVMKAFVKHGDFSELAGNWTWQGGVRLKKLRAESKARIDMVEEEAGAGTKPSRSGSTTSLMCSNPSRKGRTRGLAHARRLRRHHGGHVLLSAAPDPGRKGLQRISSRRHEPFYPPAGPGDKTQPSLAATRVDAEVINSRPAPSWPSGSSSRTDQKLRRLRAAAGRRTKIRAKFTCPITARGWQRIAAPYPGRL